MANSANSTADPAVEGWARMEMEDDITILVEGRIIFSAGSRLPAAGALVMLQSTLPCSFRPYT